MQFPIFQQSCCRNEILSYSLKTKHLRWGENRPGDNNMRRCTHTMAYSEIDIFAMLGNTKSENSDFQVSVLIKPIHVLRKMS